MDLKVITTSDQVRAIAEPWDALLEASGQADPFLSFDWIDSWWKWYGEPGGTLHIVCCYDDGALKGLLPAYEDVMPAPLRPRRLRLLSDEDLAPDRVGYLSAPDDAEEVRAAIAAYLATERGRWDVIEFANLVEGTPLAEAMRSSIGARKVAVLANRAELRPIELPETWDEYVMQVLSKGTRRRARRRLRKLEEVGPVALECIRSEEDVEQALADAYSMFEQRMTAKYDRTYAVDDAFRGFHDDITRRLLTQGRLSFQFVNVSGTRTAFHYAINAGETEFSYRTGFESDWGHLAPGTVVDFLAIKNMVGRGVRRYDMGPGPGYHKAQWGAREGRPLVRIRVYGGSPAAQFARVRDAARRAGKWLAVTLLPDSLTTRLSAYRSRRWAQREIDEQH